MPKRNVAENILNRFNTFIAVGGQIPATSDGKVNVEGLVLTLGCNRSDSQHFFRKEDIKLAVNTVAETQGLKPIGYRSGQSRKENKFKKQPIRVSISRENDPEIALENRTMVPRMQREIDYLRDKNLAFERELSALKERIRFTRETGNSFRIKSATQVNFFDTEAPND